MTSLRKTQRSYGHEAQDLKSATVVPFDRHNKRPPDYLERLRTRGWWRMWDYTYRDLGKDSIYYRSSAFREAQFAPKGVFVDAGCGWSADALIASYAGYTKSYKLDVHPLKDRNNIGEARLRKAETEQGVKFIQHDICERWPFKDNSVDLISCNAMIDLVPEEDRQLFYKEAHRVLKPGGQLSISVVNLKNGYGTDTFIERDRCTMPGWGIGFELERNYPGGFIVTKGTESRNEPPVSERKLNLGRTSSSQPKTSSRGEKQ